MRKAAGQILNNSIYNNMAHNVEIIQGSPVVAHNTLYDSQKCGVSVMEGAAPDGPDRAVGAEVVCSPHTHGAISVVRLFPVAESGVSSHVSCQAGVWVSARFRPEFGGFAPGSASGRARALARVHASRTPARTRACTPAWG